MSIKLTPNGWAIEFEADKNNSNDFANQYEQLTTGLIDTIQEAAMSRVSNEPPIYFTLQILRAMLPSYEQCKLFWENGKNN